MTEDIWVEGGKVGSFTGKLIDCPRLRSRQFEFVTALYRLRHLPRWSGDTTEPWSVLDHTMLCYVLAVFDGASPGTCAAALLHDLHEAYFPHDVPAPLLRAEPSLRKLEEENLEIVRAYFGYFDVDEAFYRKAHEYDIKARCLEAANLLPPALGRLVGVIKTQAEVEADRKWFRTHLCQSKDRRADYVIALGSCLMTIGAPPAHVRDLLLPVFDEARATPRDPLRQELLKAEEELFQKYPVVGGYL